LRLLIDFKTNKIQVNENITVDWRHNVAKKQTTCAITVDDRQVLGVSRVRTGDAYNKRIGRKLSLVRAIDLSGLDRENRTAIWQTVRNKGVKLV